MVNVKDEYDALIDPVTGFCHQFYFRMNSYGVDLIGTWNYHYQDQQYVSRTAVDDGYIFGIRKRLPDRVTDGPSLIYHFRYRTTTKSADPVLFVLDDEYKSGDIYPATQTRIFTVGDNKLETLRYVGILNCRGIVGLSGLFDAWFSIKPRPLLIRAEAKIFLGSIKIALTEYSP